MAGVDGLIDTGAILAVLDPTDPWNESCMDATEEFRLPLLTSEAVLTELFHLIRHSRIALEIAWQFVESGAIKLASINDADLPAIHSLMSRYHDRPMDFADATLVHIANREGISTILTVDHADFETYRMEGKRRFRIRPERRP